MISYSKDRTPKYHENMRGGNGTICITQVFGEEKIPHMRLFAEITLEPGSSIGAHVHENEAEAFYILEGEATVVDNGNPVKLTPGQAHLCKDGEAHALQNNSSSIVRVLAAIPTEAE
ncbi:cupin domain-containing protein [Eubacteriales bacterium OttesenSCG-928-K08]|nr:cupin domain-containing protein [Eubacteriales bacterium OttesenSCG-928-K08]